MAGRRCDAVRYSLRVGIGDLWDLALAHVRNTGENAAAAVAQFRRAQGQIERHHGRALRGMRVLEIGCGQRIPNLMMFAACGAAVVGVDVEQVGGGPWGWLRALRSDGFARVAKNAFRGLLFDAWYYRRLERSFGGALRREGVSVLKADAAALPFPDASFDAVVSFDVLEHVADTGEVLREMRRVLRRSGICINQIHLFASVSGGHNFQWQEPEARPSGKVPPWDHLRARTRPEFVHLNKLRKADYRRLIEAHFRIVATESVRRGQGLLTPEILGELAEKGYSREELTEAKWRVVAEPA